MKLIMHGLAPFRRLPPRAVSSPTGTMSTQARDGGISRAAVLVWQVGGRKNSKALHRREKKCRTPKQKVAELKGF